MKPSTHLYPVIVLVVFSFCTGLADIAFADYKDEIGFTALEEELGSQIPDGDGVEVTQIEAASGGNWMPNTDNSEFSGKTITDETGGADGVSSHANTVARYFYGDSTSIAPGITDISVFEANAWLTGGFLKINYASQPDTSTFQRRVDNHSWVGMFSGDYEYLNGEVLRRLDWIIETEESIQVVGLANSTSGTSCLLGSAYNVITVGRTDGVHMRSTVSVGDDYDDTVYEPERSRPDLVVPLDKTSYTTPVGAAALALLLEAGSGSDNAGRSEVIRAALMAGADRFSACQCDTIIGDYRSDEGDCTDNGLDTRFGAGQLNIYNSHAIIVSGEQESDGDIGTEGFDYNSEFGGAGNTEETVFYSFTANDSHTWFSVSLVWNLSIDGGSYYQFGGDAVYYNLDLVLYDITDDGEAASSGSEWDNTENLYAPLISGHDYELRVERGSDQEAFQWDYGLAWRMVPDQDGDEDGDGMADTWEEDNSLDPEDPTDAMDDPDADGLTNLEENCRGTDPNNSDTDGDQLDDGEEFDLWGDSCIDSDEDGLANLVDPDSDEDGIDDGSEEAYWGDDWDADTDEDGLYNLIDPDSDEDGCSDGYEIAEGTDPADPDSIPESVSVTALGRAPLALLFGSLLWLGIKQKNNIILTKKKH